MFTFGLRTRSRIQLVGAALMVSALVVVLLVRKPDRANATALVAVTCGQVITASITVINDLTNCPQNGLIIDRDSITITLTGHTIDGTGANGFAGVNLGSHKSVIVQGGTVQEFSYGVLLDGSTNTVKSARLTGNTYGVFMGNGIGNTITLNNIFSNTYGGYAYTFASSAKFTSNTFASNTNTGLWVEASLSAITGNHALNNTANGIFVSANASGVTLTSNIANGNGLDGIRSSSATSKLTTNTANYNTQLGINAAPGSTDGNGNKAHDNGAAKQCVNVVCP